MPKTPNKRHSLVVTITAAIAILCAAQLRAETSAQPQTEYLENLANAVKVRSAVLSAARENIVLEFSLLPQYPLCLYVSRQEASRGSNVAHDFLLQQIDFLTANGLTTHNIAGLVSYGHALFAQSFAARNGMPLSELNAEHISAMHSGEREEFVRQSCVLMGEDQFLKSLGELIRAAKES
jgi:hypothetical protein